MTSGRTFDCWRKGPGANTAELYIGIIKESVQKDMKVPNSPLDFWYHCVERRARINNLNDRRFISATWIQHIQIYYRQRKGHIKFKSI